MNDFERYLRDFVEAAENLGTQLPPSASIIYHGDGKVRVLLLDPTAEAKEFVYVEEETCTVG